MAVTMQQAYATAQTDVNIEQLLESEKKVKQSCVLYVTA